MALQERLDAFKAQLESGSAPYNVPRFVIDAIHRATDELIESGLANHAKRAGERAPDFSLKAADGRAIAMNDLLSKGPLVITFYRGVWCPYCNMDLQALEQARPEIELHGASMVAVSMQTPVNSRKAIDRHGLGFPILTDVGGELAREYGIRFALPDYLIAIYRDVFKTDLSTINDDPSWTLPMPARYIVDTDGVIAYSEVNPDYTQRPDPSELLPTLLRLQSAAA